MQIVIKKQEDLLPSEEKSRQPQLLIVKQIYARILFIIMGQFFIRKNNLMGSFRAYQKFKETENRVNS